MADVHGLRGFKSHPGKNCRNAGNLRKYLYLKSVLNHTTAQTKKQKAYLTPLKAQGQNPEQVIPYSLSSCFELVKWSGRIIRKGNRGRITDDVPPILERLGIGPHECLETMRWNNRFHRALASLKFM